jgi:type I restriction enzyme, R subunit
LENVSVTVFAHDAQLLQSMNEAEWQTRKSRIDTRLKQTSWHLVRFTPELNLKTLDKTAVEELPTANGPADYALFVTGRCLGIIEAKKVTVNPQNVLEQAKRYARGVFDAVGDWNGFRVPFLYASNGTIIWHIDTRAEKHVSRLISDFHTPDALEARFAHDTTAGRNYLRDTPVEQIGRLRPYQRDCLLAVEQAIMAGKHDMMVAMATGTGKTYVTVAQIYRLLESKLFRRILFLVDRKALAAQAVREFNAFNTPKGNKFTQEYEVYSQRFQREDLDDGQLFDPKVLPNEYLTAPNATHTFVYVSTIQRMAMNLFGAEASFAQTDGDADLEDDADRRDIPIHAFDLIIADECHRGYTAQETSIWRDTLQHFDAVRIGLTATPAAHTVVFFGEPVFRYGLQQAINDGFLVDYDPVVIHSDVRIKGVFLKEGEQIGMIDPETGTEALDHVEDEREFDSSAVERDITVPQSNRKIIEEIAKYAFEHEKETGRFPKTLIFAVNDLPHTSHADQLVRVCRDVFQQGDDFVQKITGNPNVDRPLQRIREFRNRPKPSVVVTVDMLSTGVDIPALEFIVFLRPVKSRILWEQMLGRGTRRCDDISKSHFVVFDCFDGTLFRYFKDVSAFKIEEPRPTPLTISEIIENIWQNIDRNYYTNVLVKRLHRIDKAMSPEARKEFRQWIPEGNVAEFATGLPKRLRAEFDATMKLLRNPDFQELLENYQRAKRTFWVGYDVTDQVSSRKLFGKFQKPEDYLEAFTNFVRDNESRIDALRILHKRPQDWNPEVLSKLKRELATNGFAEERLKKAHEKVHRALADVISIVKHAINEQERLLTPEERVERALEELQAFHSFNPDQQKWLTFIAEHLKENLSISEEDLDSQPVFTNRGGLARARKLFGPELPNLIDRVNYTLAAA